MNKLRNIFFLGLMVSLGSVCPVGAADWGTDAGSVIQLGGSDGLVDILGEGHLMHDGHWVAAGLETTTVESVYNLSPLYSIADNGISAGETLYVPYLVRNQGNCATEIGIELAFLGSISSYTPGIRILTDSNRDSLYNVGDVPIDSAGTAVLTLEEDSAAYLLLELIMPPAATVIQLDSAWLALTVRGNKNTGTDDNWPGVLFSGMTADNGDRQTDTFRVLIDFGGMSDLRISVTETTITSDDTLAFTVIARDSLGMDQNITALCTYLTDDTLKGEIVDNVYYPGVADSHWFRVTYQNLADSVLVIVTAGQVVWVDIPMDSLAMSVATTQLIPVTGLDSDSNIATADYYWTMDDPSLGILDSTGNFHALRGGTAWISAGWGFSRDSVFVTVTDDLPPYTWLSYLPDTIRLSAAVQLTFNGQDTAAGHQGTPPDQMVFLYNLDNQGWQLSDTAVKAFYPLPDGDHQIKVAGQDEFGNVDTLAPAVGNFNIQLSPYQLPAERWQMVSIPKDVQGQNINEVIGADSSAEVHLYRWDPQSEFDWIRLHNVDMAGTPLEPGAGYWLSASESLHIILDTSYAFITGPDTLELKTGWNQVGNYYAYPVDWRSARVIFGPVEIGMNNAIGSGVLENAVYSYDWDNDTVGYTMQDFIRPMPIDPWKGYWIKADMDCQVILPEQPYFGPSGQLKTAVPVFTPDTWQVRWTARSAKVRDDYNYMGMRPAAAAGRDIYDVTEPPLMSPYISLYMEDQGRRLAGDYRPGGAPEEEWYFAVTTDRAHQDVRLNWFNADQVPGQYHLYLYDLKTGHLLNLRQVESYTFRAGVSGCKRYFKVVASRDARFVPAKLPEKLEIFATEPNPFSLETTIRFQVPPENRRNSTVGLSVYDVNGNLVKTLVRDQLPAGSYMRTWDGRAENGKPVAKGLYICRLTTDTQTTARRIELVR